MKREDLLAQINQYERDHAVEDYEAYGLRVWAPLRIDVGVGIEFDLPQPKASTFASRAAGAIGRTARRAAEVLRLRSAQEAGPPFVEPPASFPARADAIILTYKDRVIERDGRLYHYIADPIVEELEARGISSAVWNVSDSEAPAGAPGADAVIEALPEGHAPIWTWLRTRAAHLHESRELGARIGPPEWFGEFARWKQSVTGAPVLWRHVQTRLRYWLSLSMVIEDWLRRSGCRLLITDCWYNSQSMAANLAASRLGIPSVEIQHGMQGKSHYAYVGWGRAPKRGYDFMPDFFWLWGEDAAGLLRETNSSEVTGDRVLPIGNLWLNKWRAGSESDLARAVAEARELVRPFARSILVTLQYGQDEPEGLAEAIAASPRDWIWLIRVHRRSLVDAEMEDRFRALGHPNVNLRDAGEMPLYALLRAVTNHVTGYSTCALEALAFGVPTVFAHSSGRFDYADYIEAGVMRYAPGAEAMLAALVDCDGIEADLLHRAGASAFTDAERGDALLSELLARVRLEAGGAKNLS